MNNKALILGVCVSICLLSIGAVSMSMRDYGKHCLFSGISGTITLDGKPVSDAKVKRVVGKAHTQGELKDETTTDKNGYFKMPPVFDRSVLSKVLPMEFAVPQRIVVLYEGVEHEIWNGVKRKREENAESRGAPLIVQCELTAEETLKEVDGSPIFSKCVWDAEADAPFEIMPPEDDDE